MQGPAGPFFHRLSRDLSSVGAQVIKVNFNGGDWLFYPTGAFNFRGRMEEWPAYFEDLLSRYKIDVVLLFGDCRPMHRVTSEIIQRRGLEIGVFEEGYVRPSFVTFERFGVNGNSLMPRNPEFYLNCQKNQIAPFLNVGKMFWHAALWAGLYYLAASLLKPFFKQYEHHRPLTWLEGFKWVRSVWRKAYYAVKERGVAERLTGPLSNKYFLVPLQVHNDAQIHVHSEYDSVTHFISDVIDSFAEHAPKKTVLVIKHHPMDRAYFDYSLLIESLVLKYKLQNRCFYIHDQHLPPLLKHARGVVVVNSTVGLSALYHRAPVKACGNAMYDMKGLTFQGSLTQFWRNAHQARPNKELYECFLHYLIQHTQLNGSFYKRLRIPSMASGLLWTDKKTVSQDAQTSYSNHFEHTPYAHMSYGEGVSIRLKRRI